MSSTIQTYTDWQDGEATLEVHTGGHLGVLFVADEGGQYAMPSLDRAGVEKLIEQLTDWRDNVAE
jgi:hypothetical protein